MGEGKGYNLDLQLSSVELKDLYMLSLNNIEAGVTCFLD